MPLLSGLHPLLTCVYTYVKRTASSLVPGDEYVCVCVYIHTLNALHPPSYQGMDTCVFVCVYPYVKRTASSLVPGDEYACVCVYIHTLNALQSPLVPGDEYACVYVYVCYGGFYRRMPNQTPPKHPKNTPHLAQKA